MKTINKIITKPYIHSGKLKTKITSGFATVSQKSTLVKLEVLFDAQIVIGDKVNTIKKGQFVFLLESVLHSAPWAKTKITLEGGSVDFIVIDPAYIVGVK